MNNTKKMIGILFASLVVVACIVIITLLKPNVAQSSETPKVVQTASTVASTPMPILVGNPTSEQVSVDTTDTTDYNKLVYGDNKDMTDSASGVNLDGTVNVPIEYHNTASDFSVQPQNPETDMANQLVDTTKTIPATVKAVN